jgi:hypothetical protein
MATIPAYVHPTTLGPTMPEFEVRPTVRRSTIVPRRLGDGANNTTALVFFLAAGETQVEATTTQTR